MNTDEQIFDLMKKKQSDKIKRCATHKPILLNMGYVAAHSEADRRMKKGQKQKQCPDCKLWFFKDEY